jgi:uncharacterized membrane protein YedE/YeeE
MDLIEFIKQPWPWYVAGPLLGFTVPLLLLIANKSLGISGVLRQICAACVPAKIPFLQQYDWRKDSWNLFFVTGILIGGFIGGKLLTSPHETQFNPQTVNDLKAIGIHDFSGFLPQEIFSWQHIGSLRSLIFIVLGGFLIGFGTRYSGGCTSGHGLSGLANLQWTSLLALCFFFIGGIATTYLIIPYLLKL